jgi:O-antigen ligase
MAAGLRGSATRRRHRHEVAVKIAAPADGGVSIARALLLSVFVMVLLATSITIALELAAYLAFMVAPELRRRLFAVMRHPVMIGLLPFAAVVVAATFYGPASWLDGLTSLVGWRRVLLLPLAAAVFDDAQSKRLALKVLVLTCLVGALVSFVMAADSMVLTVRLYRGIVFRNYATQGIVFSVATTVCIAAMLRPEGFAGDRMLGNRWAMAAVAAILVTDIVFVLWGRTGYLSLVVMSVAIVVLLARGTWRVKVTAGLAILVCGAAILPTSTHVRHRVAQALDEIETVDQMPEGTQFGQRVVMWRNTVRMIRDHPVFGVGTGGFQVAYRQYVQGVAGWQGHETGDPHNQFLKVQGEQGIVGLGAFLFFIVSALRVPMPVPYRQLAAAALLGWCATSLANSDFSTLVEGRLIFFWLGAMLGGGLLPTGVKRVDAQPGGSP